MAKTYEIEDGTPTDPDEKIIKESDSTVKETLMNYQQDKQIYLRLKSKIERRISDMNDLTDKWRTIKTATGINIAVPANKELASIQ